MNKNIYEFVLFCPGIDGEDAQRSIWQDGYYIRPLIEMLEL